MSERYGAVCKTPKNGSYPAKPRIGFWHSNAFLYSPPGLLDSDFSSRYCCIGTFILVCTYVLYYIIPVRHSASNVRRLYQSPPLLLPRGYCSNNIFGCHDKLNDLVRVTFHILYVHTHTGAYKIYVHIYNISIYEEERQRDVVWVTGLHANPTSI